MNSARVSTKISRLLLLISLAGNLLTCVRSQDGSLATLATTTEHQDNENYEGQIPEMDGRLMDDVEEAAKKLIQDAGRDPHSESAARVMMLAPPSSQQVQPGYQPPLPAQQEIAYSRARSNVGEGTRKVSWPNGEAAHESGLKLRLKTTEEFVKNSYVIEDTRYVEAFPTRCLTSTVQPDPYTVEPEFVMVGRGNVGLRVKATVPVDYLRRNAPFDPRLPTTILVHGFTQSYPATAWLEQVRQLHEANGWFGSITSIRSSYASDAIEENSIVNTNLQNKNKTKQMVNLIIMDWGVAAGKSYSESAALTSMIGSFLANFINKLLDLGTDRRSIRLVGHSLGAQVSAFAGKRLKPRIGRIVALDPAGPCFGKVYSNGKSDRLAPGDADEVSVYHYDDEFLGTPGQLGQWDIFVNGGSRQPGCMGNANSYFQAALTLLFNRDRPLSESHKRSYEVAVTQLSISGCQIVGYECRDFKAFTGGECGQCNDQNDQCSIVSFEWQYKPDMGVAGIKYPPRPAFPSRRLFVTTDDKGLFCLNHYQILAKLEPDPDAQVKRHGWSVWLQMVNERGGVANITLSNRLTPNIYSGLLVLEAQPVRIVSATLILRDHAGQPLPISAPKPEAIGAGEQLLRRQRERKKNRGPAPLIDVLGVDINFMSNINPAIRKAFSTRLCPAIDVSRADSELSSLQLSPCLARGR